VNPDSIRDWHRRPTRFSGWHNRLYKCSARGAGRVRAASPLPAETLARAAVRRPKGVGHFDAVILRSFFDYDQEQEHERELQNILTHHDA
jgi:hypothetical protein